MGRETVSAVKVIVTALALLAGHGHHHRVSTEARVLSHWTVSCVTTEDTGPDIANALHQTVTRRCPAFPLRRHGIGDAP